MKTGTWKYTITGSGPSEVAVAVLSERRSSDIQPIIADARWGQSQIDGSQQQDKQTVYVTVSQGLLLLILSHRNGMSHKVYY